MTRGLMLVGSFFMLHNACHPSNINNNDEGGRTSALMTLSTAAEYGHMTHSWSNYVDDFTESSGVMNSQNSVSVQHIARGS